MSIVIYIALNDMRLFNFDVVCNRLIQNRKKMFVKSTWWKRANIQIMWPVRIDVLAFIFIITNKCDISAYNLALARAENEVIWRQRWEWKGLPMANKQFASKLSQTYGQLINRRRKWWAIDGGCNRKHVISHISWI